jgi:hypothetical protein
MQKTINAILQLIDSLKTNTYDTGVKLQWINEIDGNIWTELFQYKATATITLEDGKTNYALPAGVNFNRITQAFIDGDEIPKVSKSQYKTTGISRGTGATIDLYPVPTGAGELAIVYLEEYVPHLASAVMTDTVLAEDPFDKIYILYLSAMIDFNRREFNAYNNNLILFNSAFTEYAEWLVKNNAIERRDWSCNSLLQDLSKKLSKNSKT